jgi:hypothetical protein
VAVIIGSLVTMSSAQRVPAGLVLTGIVCWSFVSLIQALVAALVIGRVRQRAVSMARALELLFMSHVPWSLWVVVLTGLFTFTTVPLGLTVTVPSLLIPAAWTAFLISAFCRVVLGCPPAYARLLTTMHQTATWTIFFTYVFLVSGFWARILALTGR